jgi:hypothetical protein
MPAIHAFWRVARNVDGRDTPGRDDVVIAS